MKLIKKVNVESKWTKEILIKCKYIQVYKERGRILLVSVHFHEIEAFLWKREIERRNAKISILFFYIFLFFYLFLILLRAYERSRS